jgi:DNA-binding transcriptional MocR family regulator
VRRHRDGLGGHVRLATRWISDGTGDALLAAVRRELAERQRLARALLSGLNFRADPAGFHLWLSLPAPWTKSAFAGHMRTTGTGIVASDAFTTGETAAKAVRVCLGGPADRNQVREALDFMAHTLTESPSVASTFL